MLKHQYLILSHFELRSTGRRYRYNKSIYSITMQSDNTVTKIDEEQTLDQETARQLARVVEFLLNIED